MLEYVAPLSKLYFANPEIVLSKVAVTVMLCPGPIISSESESVRITRGEQAEPHWGWKAGSFAIKLFELKLVGCEAKFETHHPDRSWLKRVAPLNIWSILLAIVPSFRTLLTSQLFRGWLKALAFLNIKRISIFEESFKIQSFKGWLKSLAPSNICLKILTFLTSQSLIESLPPLLKFPLLVLDLNIFDIVVTLLTYQSPRFWLKSLAFKKTFANWVTFLISQLLSGWLNFFASLNILFILVTSSVSQLFKGWLNFSAALNIEPIFRTFLTFQLFKGRLNSFAPRNISFILVTLLTVQDSIGLLLLPLLNTWAPRNIWPMFSTLLTSQDPISLSNFLASQNIANIVVTLLTLENMEGFPPLLKFRARSNILLIFLTLEVSHVLKSWLKARASRKSSNIFVTLEVSQLEISSLNVALFSNKELMSVTRVVQTQLISLGV